MMKPVAVLSWILAPPVSKVLPGQSQGQGCPATHLPVPHLPLQSMQIHDPLHLKISQHSLRTMSKSRRAVPWRLVCCRGAALLKRFVCCGGVHWRRLCVGIFVYLYGIGSGSTSSLVLLPDLRSSLPSVQCSAVPLPVLEASASASAIASASASASAGGQAPELVWQVYSRCHSGKGRTSLRLNLVPRAGGSSSKC